MVKRQFMSEAEATKGFSEKEIFFEAMEKATPEERAAYLERICGKDPSLHRRVEELLAKHFRDNSFMKEPAVAASVAGATVVLPISEGPGTIIERYKLLE